MKHSTIEMTGQIRNFINWQVIQYQFRCLNICFVRCSMTIMKYGYRKDGECNMVNTSKLKAKIVEKGLLQEAVAMQLGMTSATFNYKVNNKTEFRASEIKKLSEILQLTMAEVFAIFFAEEVE